MAGAVSLPIWISTSTSTKINAYNAKPRISYPLKTPRNAVGPILFNKTHSLYPLTIFERSGRHEHHFTPKAASSSSVGSAEEPATKVKFQRSLSLPGCSTSLSLLGTGYREKVFAIIGVKVYAAGLYVNDSVFSRLDDWRGHSAAAIQQDTSLFNMIFEANLEKSLRIVLVRDIDGKTFWDALDEAISPRIKSPTAEDKSALSTFRGVFQGKPLKKETSIFLTWIDPTKMLVSLSFDGTPSSVDATIESTNVASALFDVFLGGDPVSPSLKASVANGLEAALK
ncbi:PREDICTED: fatty-acid-binding protein 3, chloroplastic [Nicotiana attenuata]|uniref:Chalcone-flavonone isomerase family protein n=1 Tax=Nicotiana attenuata TaxID=49451 RepID=A0A1J6IRG8_NICAT|nr:PREDICTED: fatty-acid-binding protein 3, chloroplastic [Nicotiana attenuata]OIT00311.1 fatty-acid-binding protein 3, chloroplastic [Nicotiana attenuata]